MQQPQVELSESLKDIKECNKEAIHLITAVQSYGGILLFTWPDQRIHCASKNIGDFLEGSYQDVLGSKLAHVLPPEWLKKLAELAQSHPWAHSLGRSFYFEANGDSYEFYLFHSEGLFGLEIVRKKIDKNSPQLSSEEINEVVRHFHSQLKNVKDIFELAQTACKALREVTGLDRVMLYQFIYPHWHGEVIGEDRVIHAHSYMGHRFPSSDIPQPARQLYLRNKVRVISDVDSEDSLILPAQHPLTQRPLNLSDSRLRAVSKIHLRYLKNMGVQASLSFAVTVKDELWGLLACHHLSPFHLDRNQRQACELIAEAVSAYVPLVESINSYRARTSFETLLKRHLQTIVDPSIETLFKGNALIDIFNATGMALWSPSKIDFVGLTPLPAVIAEIAKFLKEKMRQKKLHFLAVDDLSEKHPQLQTKMVAAGVLAAQLETGEVLMVFRPEVVKTITWGGDPVKQLEKKEFQGDINPRVSFEAWQETIRGRSREWRPFEMEGLQFVIDFIQRYGREKT